MKPAYNKCNMIFINEINTKYECVLHIVLLFDLVLSGVNLKKNNGIIAINNPIIRTTRIIKDDFLITSLSECCCCNLFILSLFKKHEKQLK